MQIVRHYEWDEWIDVAEQGSKVPGGHQAREGWTFPSDHEGPATNAEAQRMAREEGYASALAEADRLSAHIASEVITDRLATVLQPTYDVCGSTVDMGRYMAGEPECMVEVTPIRIADAGRAVRIIVPVCYSCSVSAETVLQRGAAVMALVDVLQRAQHPLEIWATVAITGGSVIAGKNTSRMALSACVQHANEPLNMGRIMFALAHPAMLRSIGFNVEDTFPGKVKNEFGIGLSYGRAPYGAQATDVPDLPGTTIVLPELRPQDDWSDAKAVQWVNEQLDAIFGSEW